MTDIKNIDGSLLELNYTIPAYEVEQNISPIYAYRISTYTMKCLNAEGQYIVDYSVNINTENPYYREFNQTNHQGEEAFWERLQFNRNLDLLYMTNSAGDSFYADYDDNHNLISLVIPNPENNNFVENGDMEIPNGGAEYPAMWETTPGLSDTNFETNYTNETTYEDAYVTFKNSIDKTLILFQTKKPFNGKAGDKYVISSWGKGEATVPRESHFWGIRILAEDKNGEFIEIHQMSFDTSLWSIEQTRATAFSLPFDTTAIIIQLVSDEQRGNVSFDDVCLYKAENAYVAAVDDVETESTCKCEGCEYPFCTCAC